MNASIQHLPGTRAATLVTSRLRTEVLSCGPEDGTPVLFLHGNLSAATFWEETMLALPASFHGVAPDQRGYGSSDPAARVDATGGVAVWVEDALALADSLGWDRFHVVAHSLGGCIAWGLIGLHAERLRSVTLVAPGPPCGFGGTRGANGELNHDDGAGSGAGLVHPRLLEFLAAGEREITDPAFSPRAVMRRLYWKPPFTPAREERLLTAMLQVHLGDDGFPGDQRPSPHWPGFAPGTHGPANAMSPLYNRWVLPSLLAATPKPPLLWVHGADDLIIRDGSLSDAGTQGQLGLRPGWPGAEVFPPQPFLTQVEFALDGYEQTGGTVHRKRFADTGHTPYMEKPTEFNAALAELLG